MPKILKFGEIKLSDAVVELPEPELDELCQPDLSAENQSDKSPEQLLAEKLAAHAKKAALKEAEEQAAKLYEQMIRRAEKERQDLLDQTQSECEHLKTLAYQDAYQNAYAEALQKKTRELETELLSAHKTLGEWKLHMEDYLTKYEENLRWLALDIASKVMCKKIADDDTQMLELVHHGITSVKNAEWISVTLSDKIDRLYSVLAEELKASQMNEKVQISLKDVPPGTCRIETPTEVLDISISEQLENLKEIFQ